MNDHSIRSHKRFAASAAERWWNCPGSIRLCDGLPEQAPTSCALEGTRAHEWLEWKLAGGETPADKPPAHELTPEMLEAIDIFKDEVKKALSTGSCLMIVEKQTEIYGTAAGTDIGGTTDFAAFNPDLHKLWLIDFKYGAGVAVGALNNKQLRCYDLSVLDSYGWKPTVIENVIVQPRAFHPDGPVRRETLDIAELYDFRLDLEEHVAACLEPDAPLVPGDEQCRWCPAKTFCPALESRALAVAGESFKSVQQIQPGSLPDVKGLTPDRIGHILSAKALIDDWLQAVEAEGYRLAISGVQIPDHKLVHATGRRSFNGTVMEASTKLEAISGLPAAEFVRESMVTLEDAEKFIKQTMRPKGRQAVKDAMEKFAFLTTKKSSGKLQLVRNDDARPAVNPASDAFKDVIKLPYIGETE